MDVVGDHKAGLARICRTLISTSRLSTNRPRLFPFDMPGPIPTRPRSCWERAGKATSRESHAKCRKKPLRQQSNHPTFAVAAHTLSSLVDKGAFVGISLLARFQDPACLWFVHEAKKPLKMEGTMRGPVSI